LGLRLIWDNVDGRRLLPTPIMMKGNKQMTDEMHAPSPDEIDQLLQQILDERRRNPPTPFEKHRQWAQIALERLSDDEWRAIQSVSCARAKYLFEFPAGTAVKVAKKIVREFALNLVDLAGGHNGVIAQVGAAVA
jgi:hypothetical protein